VKLPEIVLTELEKTLDGLNFGRATLEVTVHDQKPKFRIIVERSIVPGSETSGSAQVARS
jgi:hypothetical protein